MRLVEIAEKIAINPEKVIMVKGDYGNVVVYLDGLGENNILISDYTFDETIERLRVREEKKEEK